MMIVAQSGDDIALMSGEPAHHPTESRERDLVRRTSTSSNWKYGDVLRYLGISTAPTRNSKSDWINLT